MIFRASNGAEILDKIEIDEEEALIQYPSIIISFYEEFYIGFLVIIL